MHLVKARHIRSLSSAVPSGAALRALVRGDIVKIGTLGDRFWVEIRRVVPATRPSDIKFIGSLRNNLVSTPGRCGDVIEFRGKHIYTIYPPQRGFVREELVVPDDDDDDDGTSGTSRASGTELPPEDDPIVATRINSSDN